MRELHETESDRDIERKIVSAYAEHTGCKAHYLPGQYRVDVALSRMGSVVAFAEIKRRHIEHLQYDTIMLSLGKWLYLTDLAERTERSVMFVIGFNDVCAAHHLGTSPTTIEYGGRTKNTRDSGDIEPVIHIDSRLFRPFANAGDIYGS